MSSSSTAAIAKKMMRTKMRELISQKKTHQQTKRESTGNWHCWEMESGIVQEKLLRNEWFIRAKRISMYVSNEQEVLTDNIIRHALRNGKEVFIPRFRKGSQRMEMVRLNSAEEFEALECTLWGIRQHSTELESPSFDETSAENPLDVVIMPGLAFTSCGKRLGHGKGYYDRFLNEYSQKFGSFPKTIGLALQVQLVDDLPMEDHDRKVDVVLHA